MDLTADSDFVDLTGMDTDDDNDDMDRDRQARRVFKSKLRAARKEQGVANVVNGLVMALRKGDSPALKKNQRMVVASLAAFCGHEMSLGIGSRSMNCVLDRLKILAGELEAAAQALERVEKIIGLSS